MPLSQADQLLLRLMNGEWWTTRELLREVPCIVHSRISDLRAQGFIVEHRTTGVGAAGSEYRLIGDVTGGRPRKPGTYHEPLKGREATRVGAKGRLGSPTVEPRVGDGVADPTNASRPLSGPDSPPGGTTLAGPSCRPLTPAAPSDREDQERSGQAGQLSLTEEAA